jgi:hypothetical protein
MEVQRMNTIAPLTAPHRATKDTKLLGYNIPKVKIIEFKLFRYIQNYLNIINVYREVYCQLISTRC